MKYKMAGWLQAKPVSVDQLVAASGNMQRLVNLATLSDSLDYLADAMQHFGDSQHTRRSALVTSLPVPAFDSGLLVTATMTDCSATEILQCIGFQALASGCPADCFASRNKSARHLCYDCMLQLIMSVQLCLPACTEQGSRAFCIHEA